MNRPTKTHETWFFIVLLVLVSEVTYLRPNLLEYGRLDDFSGLLNSKTNSLIPGVFHSWFQAGRLIPAFFGSLLFSATNSVGDLRYLRLFSTGVLGIGGGILSWFSWRLMDRRNSISCAGAILVGIIAITTTSAPSIATWATFATQIITFPLALLGGVLCTLNRKILNMPWWFCAFILIVASAFCYQQFVPLAVLPVSLWAATEFVSKNDLQWRKIAIVLTHVVVALGLNAVFVYTFGDGAQDRVLREPFTQRIHWFIGTYTPRTIDIFMPNSKSSGIISLAILAILMLIPILITRKYVVFTVATLISWSACAAVAFPTQLWASYRLIYPAQIALWGSATFGAIYSLRNLNSRKILLGASVIALVVIFQAEFRGMNYIAKPNHYDWETTKCKIAENPNTNVFVVNEWYVSRSPVYLYDEYGTVGSNFDWVLKLSVTLSRLEIYEKSHVVAKLENPKLISSEDAKSLEPNSFIVIDQRMCN